MPRPNCLRRSGAFLRAGDLFSDIVADGGLEAGLTSILGVSHRDNHLLDRAVAGVGGLRPMICGAPQEHASTAQSWSRA